MLGKKRGGPLNPMATRQSILDAALIQLADKGREGVSFSEVARLANVDRGTAHRHFQTLDDLLKATASLVSEQLLQAVFGDTIHAPESLTSEQIMEQNTRLLNFGMDNPELCRVWLYETLSADNPSSDPFWKAFSEAYTAFGKMDGVQEDLNSEVLAVLMLAATFLWPIWVRAHAKSDIEKQKLAKSFSDECLRLSMYGSLKPEFFPEIGKHLEKSAKARAKA